MKTQFYSYCISEQDPLKLSFEFNSWIAKQMNEIEIIYSALEKDYNTDIGERYYLFMIYKIINNEVTK